MEPPTTIDSSCSRRLLSLLQGEVDTLPTLGKLTSASAVVGAMSKNFETGNLARYVKHIGRGATCEMRDVLEKRGDHYTFVGFPQFDSNEVVDDWRLNAVANRIQAVIKAKTFVFEPNARVDFYADYKGKPNTYPFREHDPEYFCAVCRGLMKVPRMIQGRILYESAPSGECLPKNVYHTFRDRSFPGYHMVDWAPSHSSYPTWDTISGYIGPFRHMDFLYEHAHYHFIADKMIVNYGFLPSKHIRAIHSYMIDCVMENAATPTKNNRIRSFATGMFHPDGLSDADDDILRNLLGVQSLQACFYPRRFTLDRLSLQGKVEVVCDLLNVWNSISEELQDSLLDSPVKCIPDVYDKAKEWFPEFHQQVGFSVFSDVDLDDLPV